MRTNHSSSVKMSQEVTVKNWGRALARASGFVFAFRISQIVVTHN